MNSARPAVTAVSRGMSLRFPDSATMLMLKLGVEAWHDSLKRERASLSRMDLAGGRWWGRRRVVAEHHRTLAGLGASRVVLRASVRVMGAHLRRDGLRPEQLVPALHDALGRVSRGIHIAVNPEFTQLARDVVTWGIEGYYDGRA
jgi:hypothetical protein